MTPLLVPARSDRLRATSTQGHQCQPEQRRRRSSSIEAVAPAAHRSRPNASQACVDASARPSINHRRARSDARVARFAPVPASASGMHNRPPGSPVQISPGRVKLIRRAERTAGALGALLVGAALWLVAPQGAARGSRRAQLRLAVGHALRRAQRAGVATGRNAHALVAALAPSDVTLPGRHPGAAAGGLQAALFNGAARRAAPSALGAGGCARRTSAVDAERVGRALLYRAPGWAGVRVDDAGLDAAAVAARLPRGAAGATGAAGAAAAERGARLRGPPLRAPRSVGHARLDVLAHAPRGARGAGGVAGGAVGALAHGTYRASAAHPGGAASRHGQLAGLDARRRAPRAGRRARGRQLLHAPLLHAHLPVAADLGGRPNGAANRVGDALLGVARCVAAQRARGAGVGAADTLPVGACTSWGAGRRSPGRAPQRRIELAALPLPVGGTHGGPSSAGITAAGRGARGDGVERGRQLRLVGRHVRGSGAAGRRDGVEHRQVVARGRRRIEAHHEDLDARGEERPGLNQRGPCHRGSLWPPRDRSCSHRWAWSRGRCLRRAPIAVGKPVGQEQHVGRGGQVERLQVGARQLQRNRSGRATPSHRAGVGRLDPRRGVRHWCHHRAHRAVERLRSPWVHLGPETKPVREGAPWPGWAVPAERCSTSRGPCACRASVWRLVHRA